MDHTVEIYETEKELREKRLAAYAEAIQKKVQRNSEQIIKELVEERYRQKKTQTKMNKAPWSSGQDASLSRWNQGFDSPRSH